MNLPVLRTIAVVLFTVVFAGILSAADKPAAGTIEVTLLGDVARKGKIQLRTPAAMEDAFVAAGGFLSVKGSSPPDFCILMTRDHGVDMNMHVRVKVNLKTRAIHVIDEAKRTEPLKDGDTLIVPVITR